MTKEKMSEEFGNTVAGGEIFDSQGTEISNEIFEFLFTRIHQAIAEERERINNKVKDWRRGMSMLGKEVDTFNKAHEQILKVLLDTPVTDK